jgi:hypothetical protein
MIGEVFKRIVMVLKERFSSEDNRTAFHEKMFEDFRNLAGVAEVVWVLITVK